MNKNKITLITGANKGIGYEVARQLGKDGFKVLIGARDTDRGEKATQELRNEGIDAHFIHIDVTDESSAISAAKMVENDFGYLDVLINNAGIVLPGDGAPSNTDLSKLTATFDVNVFGPVRITKAFTPLLKKSSFPRVVMVTSSVGSLTVMSDPQHPYYNTPQSAYCISKTALNALTVSLSKELSSFGFKINAADPGWTSTDLNSNTGPGHVSDAAKTIVRLAKLDENGPTGGVFNNESKLPW